MSAQQSSQTIQLLLLTFMHYKKHVIKAVGADLKQIELHSGHHTRKPALGPIWVILLRVIIGVRPHAPGDRTYIIIIFRSMRTPRSTA